MSGAVCDTTESVCKKSCTDDDQCKYGAFCDTTQKVCEIPCTSHTQDWACPTARCFWYDGYLFDKSCHQKGNLLELVQWMTPGTQNYSKLASSVIVACGV